MLKNIDLDVRPSNFTNRNNYDAETILLYPNASNYAFGCVFAPAPP